MAKESLDEHEIRVIRGPIARDALSFDEFIKELEKRGFRRETDPITGREVIRGLRLKP